MVEVRVTVMLEGGVADLWPKFLNDQFSQCHFPSYQSYQKCFEDNNSGNLFELVSAMYLNMCSFFAINVLQFSQQRNVNSCLGAMCVVCAYTVVM